MLGNRLNDNYIKGTAEDNFDHHDKTIRYEPSYIYDRGYRMPFNSRSYEGHNEKPLVGKLQKKIKGVLMFELKYSACSERYI